MEEILIRLKQIRIAKGLKQADFGKILEVAQNSYSQIETGVTPLKDRHIDLICYKLNVSESWLRNGEGVMFKDTFSTRIIPDDIGLSGIEK